MPRKVYIASTKSDTEKAEVFGLLGNRFSLTASPADAEFIVLDCDDPAAPRVWVAELATLVVPEKCYPPIVLATNGSRDPTFLRSLGDVYPGDVSELYLCEGTGNLLETLNKLEAALPFYNAKNAPPVDLAKAREMAIFILKSGPPATSG
jgi:hypothetical protein